MADNTRGGSQDAGDPLIATDEVTYSGDTADVQLVRVVGVTGSEGSKTITTPAISATDRAVDGVLDAADETVEIDTDGAVAVVFVSQTDSDLDGSLQTEASSDDGATWYTIRPMVGHEGGARVSAGFPYLVDGADLVMGNYLFTWTLTNVADLYLTNVRVRVAAYTSGSAVIRAIALQNIVWNQDGIPVTRLVGLDNVALPADLSNGLDVDVTRLPALSAGTNNIGDVDVASEPKTGTATLSNVASSASSVTLLSSNASRLGATIHNDSTQILYVKFGTTASATSYTVKMVADAYYELPFRYTGRLDGIWASANGNARVTEMT